MAEAAESFPINIESKDNATLISLAKLQGRATGSKGLTGDFDLVDVRFGRLGEIDVQDERGQGDESGEVGGYGWRVGCVDQ